MFRVTRNKGKRHRLMHGYFGVERSIIWDTITLHIPTLLTHLRALLSTER